MPVMEPNFYGTWAAKQTARGTAATTAARRYAQVTGDFNVNRSDGSENVGDLAKYNPSTDWVNSIVGNGTPGIEATPDELAHLLWLFHGAETVTAVTGPPAAQRHVFTPTLGRGHWTTFWARVGQSVIRRHKFNDSIITQVQIEGSTANKAVRVTPTVLSLDPGEVFTTDPASPASLPVDKSFLYTDGAGSFVLDGTTFTEQSQFSLVINDAWDVVYGDDVYAYDLVQGDPSVTISATMYFSDKALAQWNRLVYNTTTPAAGTKPIRRVLPLGSYAFSLVQRDATGAATGRSFDVTLPYVKWTVPDAPGPNPDGGSTEIALAGSCRPGASPIYTLGVNTANTTVAFTA